jgi:prepilin-type N-terminal cleavage/methylation domain-containing protein
VTLTGSRRGFSIVELLIAMTLMSAMLALAYPRFDSARMRESTISARREVANQVARARTAAAQRGCRATLHLNSTTERVWVTACRATGTGIDTIGQVSNLSVRYTVNLTSTADSLGFAPTSLALGTTAITLTFARGTQSSTMTISSIGRATW